MLELVKCPKCGRYAVGRSDWPAERAVRCPYCPAEFVFGRAIEQPLQELTPLTIEEQAAAPPPVQAEPDTTSHAVEHAPSGTPAPETDVGLVEVPDDDAAKPSEESPGEPFLVGEAVPLPRSYAEAYDFLPEQQKRQLETAGAVAARLRGDRRQRSCLGELAKIVLGGLVGLAIGYWLLNYFGGAKYDWLEVYLPGCRHTADHWPAEYFREEPPAPPTFAPEVQPREPIPLRRVPKPVPLPSEPSPDSGVTPPPADSILPPPAEPSAPGSETNRGETSEPKEPALQQEPSQTPSLPGLDELKKSER